jgi:hypothetical protein
MVGLYDSVMKKYPNLDFLEEELTEAFISFKSYFPNKPIPKSIYMHYRVCWFFSVYFWR